MRVSTPDTNVDLMVESFITVKWFVSVWTKLK